MNPHDLIEYITDLTLTARAAVIAAKSEDDALVEVGALLEILGAIAGMDQRVLEAAE